MFQAIRKHLNPATIMAFVALVFAITGGAFAATGGGSSPSHATLTASAAKKKPKPKSTRGPAGPKGATGAPGPVGPAGPAGAGGAKGENGAAGTPGTNGEKGEKGTAGTAGTSVTSKEVKVGEAACNKEGGSEFTAGASKTTACNGKTGFTETLPKGKTETGTWIAQGSDFGAGEIKSGAISLPIPLASSPESTVVVKAGEATPVEFCLGNEENPGAKPGHACIFEAPYAGLFVFAFHGSLACAGDGVVNASGTGTGLSQTGGWIVCGTKAPITLQEKEEGKEGVLAGGEVSIGGTWAVTAQ